MILLVQTFAGAWNDLSWGEGRGEWEQEGAGRELVHP